jgi:hypothetical protein
MLMQLQAAAMPILAAAGGCFKSIGRSGLSLWCKSRLDLTKVFTGFPLIYWIVNILGMHVPRFEKNKSFHTVHMEELNLVHYM